MIFQDPYSTLNPKHSVGQALREALGASAGAQAQRHRNGSHRCWRKSACLPRTPRAVRRRSQAASASESPSHARLLSNRQFSFATNQYLPLTSRCRRRCSIYSGACKLSTSSHISSLRTTSLSSARSPSAFMSSILARSSRRGRRSGSSLTRSTRIHAVSSNQSYARPFNVPLTQLSTALRRGFEFRELVHTVDGANLRTSASHSRNGHDAPRADLAERSRIVANGAELAIRRVRLAQRRIENGYCGRNGAKEILAEADNLASTPNDCEFGAQREYYASVAAG